MRRNDRGMTEGTDEDERSNVVDARFPGVYQNGPVLPVKFDGRIGNDPRRDEGKYSKRRTRLAREAEAREAAKKSSTSEEETNDEWEVLAPRGRSKKPGKSELGKTENCTWARLDDDRSESRSLMTTRLQR